MSGQYFPNVQRNVNSGQNNQAGMVNRSVPLNIIYSNPNGYPQMYTQTSRVIQQQPMMMNQNQMLMSVQQPARIVPNQQMMMNFGQYQTVHPCYGYTPIQYPANNMTRTYGNGQNMQNQNRDCSKEQVERSEKKRLARERYVKMKAKSTIVDRNNGKKRKKIWDSSLYKN